LNGHIGLIHSILPATVDLHVKIPESHPSARNLGSERVGSGTIIDPDGYILTVHYVTVGASSITATLSDGEQYPAQIAAEDQETGLSLVKISAHDLPSLKLAPPDSVTLGQAVVMIASNGEASRRVSGGYVTSTEGYDGQWEYMLDKSIRITASNPGFGGGTLANFRAELLGVVSLNLSEVGKFTLASAQSAAPPVVGYLPPSISRTRGDRRGGAEWSGREVWSSTRRHRSRGRQKRDPFAPGALSGDVEKAPGRTDLV
jgi:S1-C subfamily serine protease